VTTSPTTHQPTSRKTISQSARYWRGVPAHSEWHFSSIIDHVCALRTANIIIVFLDKTFYISGLCLLNYYINSCFISL